MRYVSLNVPIDAIFAEDEIPEGQEHFIELNQELAEIWPNITEQKAPLKDAKKWNGGPQKIKFLER